MIAAFFTGLLLSFIGSMTPTGPIAIIVLKYGMSGQKRSALFVAGGAALAEAGYALLAYLGITFALARYPVETSMLRFVSGGILIAFAAVWIIKGRFSGRRRREREYVGTSFLLGMSIAGLNPTFLITWGGAVAIARGAGLISDIHAAPAFACGVVAGPLLWFWILLTLLNRRVQSLSPEKLKKFERALPILLLILAAVILGQAIHSLLK